MKKIVFTLLAAFLTLAVGTASYAAAVGSEGGASGDTFELDGSIGPASGPDGYDGGFGGNFGVGYMLKSINDNLQARFDISFYHFNNDFPWGSGTYTRVPLTISARYYVPVANRMRAFGQAGLETSVDNYDNYANQRVSEVNLGLAPGAGIEFFVDPRASIFVLGVAHLIADSYFSMQFGMAAHF